MVTALGIDVTRAFTLVFALGGALAGLAGVLGGIYFGSLSPHQGTSLLIFAFVVVIIGGLGSIPGVALSALSVGLVQQYANYYAGGYGDLAVIILLAAVVLARPKAGTDSPLLRLRRALTAPGTVRRRHGMTDTRTPRAMPAAAPVKQSAPPRAGRLRRARSVTVPAAVLLVLALLPYSAVDIPVLLDGPVNSRDHCSCSRSAWSSARSRSATT
ncbi:ABC transporter permease subunit [Streptomyces sp. INA 01156]